MKDTDLAIYVHWPYCLSKCPYCDFNSHEASSFDYQSWLDSYRKELDSYKDFLFGKNIISIFFGGGTPSLMDPSIIEGIIEHIGNLANLDDNIEITLEANPTSSEYSKFEKFKKSGINRISVGIQSINEKDLKKLGRQHSPEEAINAIKMARDIFDRYSFDIIYTREGQSLNSWKDELSQIMELSDGHISLYQLTIEKATPFYSMHRKGKLILPENEVAADMYQHSLDYLRALGYNRYEISNFAKAGDVCRHNLVYWNYDNYLGIGPGSHSRISFDGKSVCAIMDYHGPAKWMNLIKEGSSPIQNKIALSKEELIEEIIMMGLRLEVGVTSEKLMKYLNLELEDVIDKNELEKFEEAGFIKRKDSAIALTDSGMMMHSYIVPRILKDKLCI